jgi:hypothetical protein
MNNIPKDIIVYICVNHINNISDIFHLSLTCKRNHNNIFGNSTFWMNRLKRDYGQYGHDPIRLKGKDMGNISWKDYYTIVYQYTMGGTNTETLHSRILNNIIHNNINAVRIMLNNVYLDPTYRDNEIIKYASRWGDTDIVKLLLEDGRVDPATSDNHPIFIASRGGHINIVKMLLDYEDVDPAADHHSAIRVAAYNGHEGIVRLLLDDHRVNIPKGSTTYKYLKQFGYSMDQD